MVRISFNPSVVELIDGHRFPLSEVPSGWKPNPRRVWNASVNKENETVSKGIQQDESPRTHGEWKRSLLSADEVCYAASIVLQFR